MNRGGFTNEQSNYINGLVIERVKDAKRVADSEHDKAMNDLRVEMRAQKDAMQSQIDALQAQIREIKGDAARQNSADNARTDKMQVARIERDMRVMVGTTVKEVAAIVKREAAQEALTVVRREVNPQLNDMKRLMIQTAAEVALNNDNQQDMVHQYQLASMVEAETSQPGRKARPDIQKNAVRMAFDEDDIV